MAKGLGLIGNFKGKVGNMVGYSLKDSNNKQTQGIRVYQPVVRNPKTSAQAEQRARMMPINRFYRALKFIIDRGQEGLAYGNKSRLAWLSDAMKGFAGPWLPRTATGTLPLLTPLTKGSLADISFRIADGRFILGDVIGAQTAVNTVGSISTIIKASFPHVQDGDQVTFVFINVDTTTPHDAMNSSILSIIIDTTSTEPISIFGTYESAGSTYLVVDEKVVADFATVILSREGTSGQHLRSTSKLQINDADYTDTFYTDNAKKAAIATYMAEGSNTDWPQEQFVDA